MLDVLTKDAASDGVGELCGAVVEHLDSPLNTGLGLHSLREVQVCLHSNMQTSLRATRAKCFAMKTIGEQAKEFREAQGWSYTRMAQEVTKRQGSPVSRQLITQLEEKGDRRPHYLIALAQVMGVSIDALLTGNSPAPVPAKFEDLQPEEAGSMSKHTRRVPVVGTARMGDDGYYDEISFAPGAGDGHIDIATTDPNAYGLRVRGNSMMPAIRDGWYVLVEPNGTPSVGEYVLIKLVTGERMVKELLYQRAGSIEIVSVNGGERRTIYPEELEAIQAVAAVVSPSKWKPDL